MSLTFFFFMCTFILTSTTFFQMTIISLLCGLGTVVEDHLNIHEVLFLQSLFCFIGLNFCLYASKTHCFDYYKYVYVLKSGNVTFPISYLFLKTFLAMHDPLKFHMNFTIFIFFSSRCSKQFHRNI
jgi:hypothetical protein